jgi:uncharacterized Zn finger protein (UPF0148 family)
MLASASDLLTNDYLFVKIVQIKQGGVCMVVREIKQSDNLEETLRGGAGIIEKSCPACGYIIRVTQEKSCRGCGLPVKQLKEINLPHYDIVDIPKDMPPTELNPLNEIIEDYQDRYKKETWISGSYCLVGFSNFVTIGLVEAGMANPFCLPIVLSSSLLMTSFLGACQLQHSRAHLGATFSSLMSVSLKNFFAWIFSGRI